MTDWSLAIFISFQAFGVIVIWNLINIKDELKKLNKNLEAQK